MQNIKIFHIFIVFNQIIIFLVMRWSLSERRAKNGMFTICNGQICFVTVTKCDITLH